MNLNSSPAQNKKLIYFLVIWAAVSALGLYVRLYPLFYNTSYAASEQASLAVLSNLRHSIGRQIEASHPNLSPLEKQKLLQTEVNNILHKNNTKVRQTIDQVAKTIDQDGPHKQPYPYLQESDSYYYFDLTQSLAKTGKISDQIKGSKYFNWKMLAPLGYWQPLNLHPYIGYSVYRFLAWFNPDIPLMFAVSFTPLFMVSFCVLVFLLICYYWRCPPFISFISAVFFVMAPIFVKRSTFAWYDDDSYSIFFPLIILWIIFNALQNRHNFRSLLRWTAAACLSINLYALFWHGWVFFLSVFMIAGLAIVIGNHWLLRKSNETKNLLIFFGLLGLGTLGSVSVAFGPSQFFILFKEGWIALNDFLNPKFSLWPDLYIAVGELLKAPFNTTVNLAGGYLFVLVALIGLGISLVRSLRDPEKNYFSEIILTGTLLFFTAIMAFGAQRFILLWLVPLSVLFPLGLKYLWEWAHNYILKEYPSGTVRKTFLGFALFAGLALVIFRSYASYIQVPSLLNRIFNDVWAETFEQVKTKTPPGSIINTWWPPGHFIKAMADRRVTFDGATINKPQAYWLANVFLSTDERKALGILRMLNDSANLAVEYLQELGMPLSKAVQLLKDITPLNESQAREKIGSFFKNDQTDHLLALTHKAPPPSYLLVYNELVENNIQLSFVGNWNFAEAERLNADRQLAAKLPSKNSKEYVSFLWNIAGGRPRFSEPLNLLAKNPDKVLFAENLQIDLNDMLVKINSPQYGNGVPLSIFYEKDGKLIEKVQPRASLPYSVLYYNLDGLEQAILLDRSLAKSLIIQMYYFKGKGLRYLHPIIKETDLTKRTQISVYAVDWEQFLADLNTP